MKKLNQDGQYWTSNEPFSVDELQNMVRECEKEMEQRRLRVAYALSSVDHTRLAKDEQDLYVRMLKNCLNLSPNPCLDLFQEPVEDIKLSPAATEGNKNE